MRDWLNFYLNPDHALATVGVILILLIGLCVLVVAVRDFWREAGKR